MDAKTVAVLLHGCLKDAELLLELSTEAATVVLLLGFLHGNGVPAFFFWHNALVNNPKPTFANLSLIRPLVGDELQLRAIKLAQARFKWGGVSSG